MLLAVITLQEADEIQHFLRDRARTVGTLAAEEVERHAARRRGADRRVAHCNLQFRGIVRVLLFLETAIVAVAGTQVPVHATVADGKFTEQSGAEHQDIDFLEVQAPAGFQRSPGEERHIAVRHRQIDTEGVIRIQSRNKEVVVDAVSAALAEAQWLGRRFRCRRSIRIRATDEQVDHVGQFMRDVGIQVDAFVRRAQVVVTRAVEIEARLRPCEHENRRRS